jgi:hypothetical protein
MVYQETGEFLHEGLVLNHEAVGSRRLSGAIEKGAIQRP